jgi:hypothetical protein
MDENLREQATKIIEDIREDNGGISKEDRGFLEAEKPHILKALSSTRRKLSLATKTYLTLQ